MNESNSIECNSIETQNLNAVPLNDQTILNEINKIKHYFNSEI